MTPNGIAKRETDYRNWAEKHPTIVAEFTRIAIALYEAGVRAYSAQDIVAVMRMQSRTGCKIVFPSGQEISCSGEEVIVSRNFITYMARNLVVVDKRFQNFFDFRALS